MSTPDFLRHLAEDATPAEAEALRPVLEQLRAWPAPVPSRAETRQLLAALAPATPRPAHNTQWLRWAGALIRAQARVVRGELWLGSALVLLLGVMVTLVLGRGPADATSVPFVLLAPLVAAVGTAFLFGPANDPVLELQLATPASPRLILLARLALLFGYDLILGVAGSLLLALVRADLSLWPLIETWLAPMAFLSALAFLLSVIFVEPLVGALASLGLWSLQVLRSMILPTGLTLAAYLPNLAAPEARGLLWLGVALLIAAALWVGGRQERWMQTR